MHALHCFASTDQVPNAISEPGKVSQEEQDRLRSTRKEAKRCMYGEGGKDKTGRIETKD